MAMTMAVIQTNVGKLVAEEPPFAIMEFLGGNPYPAGGLAVTAATLETAINTFLATGNVDVTSITNVTGVGASPDGTYYAVWNGTNVEIFLNTTGVEAGAIDLSAATTKVRATVEFVRKY
jgi:hypothetical protein